MINSAVVHITDGGVDLLRFGSSSAEPIASGTPTEISPSLMPGHCGLDSLRTTGDEASLLLPAGAIIDVAVDAQGQLSGELR